MDRLVYFFINGWPAVGALTGRDYDEIEVTTKDGRVFYMDDSWLDAGPHEASQ